MAKENMSQKGFTLVELMVAMLAGMIVLAGLISFFIAFQNSSANINSQAEIFADTFLVSRIMSSAIKESPSTPHPTVSILTNLSTRGVTLPAGYPTTDSAFVCLPFYDAISQTLTYQDLEGNVGIFQYQSPGNPDKIYWLSTSALVFEEMIRNLDPTHGFTISGNCVSTGSPITITSVYGDNNAPEKVSATFLAYPRN